MVLKNKIITIWIIILLLLTIQIPIATSNAGYYIQEYNTATTTGIQPSAKVGGPVCFAQIFRTNEMYNLTRISILLDYNGVPVSGNITMALREVSTEPDYKYIPTGANLTTSTTSLDASTITANTWYNFSFNNYQILKNHNYSICVFMYDGVNVSGQANYIQGLSDNNGVDIGVRNCNVYNVKVSEDGGTTWINNSLYDGLGSNQFRTYSDTILVNETSPANGSTNQDLFPNICINLTNEDSNSMTIFWEWYNGSAWIPFDHLYTGTEKNISNPIVLESDYIDTWLHDFPILVNITSDDLKDCLHGGYAQTDGDDFTFWSADNTTRYWHEIENYDGTTGTLQAWVNITDISPTTDTTFYIQYGNESAPNMQSPRNVWDGNYLSVFHMNTSDPLFDSSMYAVTSSKIGNCTEDSGKVYNATNFTGTLSSYYNLSNVYHVNDTNFTLECWIQNHGFASDYGTILDRRNLKATSKAEIYCTIARNPDSYDIRLAAIDFDDDALYIDVGPDNYIDDNQWHYFAGFRNGSSMWGRLDQLYYKTSSNAAVGSVTGSADVKIGRNFQNTTNQFGDSLDEFRFSNISRNESWLNATYYSINNSDTFITMGAQYTNQTVSSNRSVCTYYENATACGTTYYYRVNVTDVDGNYINNTYHFTTFIPQPPIDLTVTNINGTALNISWTNYSLAGTTGNYSNIVRYSDSAYPTTLSEGTLVENTSNESTILSGLDTDKTYYFSIWTYYEKNGSSCFSGSYATKSGSTGGGTYNITIKWECNQTTLSPGGYGTDEWGLFLNGTLTGYTKEGEIINQTNPTHNPFSINFSKTPEIISFEYDNLTRSVTPFPGQNRVNIYICCEEEYQTWYDYNYSNYQFQYKFEFQDYTPASAFASVNDSRLYIYRYNSTGIKYYVHMDYWSGEDTVTTSLEYGERYYLAVQSSNMNISFLQYVDLLFDGTQYGGDLIIVIQPDENITYTWSETAFVSIEKESTTSMWINYTDRRNQTNNGTIRIYRYYSSNDTYLLVYTYIFTTSKVNHKFTEALGYSNSADYLINITVGHALFSYNQTLSGWIYKYIEAIYQTDWINMMFIKYLGICPMDPLSWTQMFSLLILILVIILFSMAGEVEAGMVFSGIILITLQTIFQDSIAFKSLAIAVGVFMILLGMVFYSGRQRGG